MSKLMNINENSNVEQTLIMLKPDILEQNLVLPIVMSLYGKYGFNITNLQVVEMNKTQALEFYNNAHENRLNKLNSKIETEKLSPEDIQKEHEKFNETNNRNANFISSGKMVAISIENPKPEGDKEKFIQFVRGIVENDLRKSYSSNYDEFTFACNGIHAADSFEALKRDVGFIEEYKINNRDLSEVYPKSDMPERKIPADKDYIKSVLVKNFETVFSNENLKKIIELEGFKGFKSVLNGYKIMLDNYANNPNISNAILLKNSTDFISNGLEQSKYKLKDEKQLNLLNGVSKIIKDLTKEIKLDIVIELINSKTTGVIDQTIGKNRDLYLQMHTNKPFKQQNIKDTSPSFG